MEGQFGSNPEHVPSFIHIRVYVHHGLCMQGQFGSNPEHVPSFIHPSTYAYTYVHHGLCMHTCSRASLSSFTQSIRGRTMGLSLIGSEWS